MMNSNNLIKGFVLFLVLILLGTIVALAFYGSNAYFEGKSGTTSFKASIIIFLLEILGEALCLGLIIRKPDVLLRWVSWLYSHSVVAGMALLVLILSSSTLSVWNAWMKLFSAAGDAYSSLVNLVLLANKWNSLFIWEWLIFVLICVFIGSFFLFRKSLLREIIHQTRTGSLLILAAYFLCCIGICLIGVQRVIPLWLISNSNQVERFVKEPLYFEARLWLWGWVAGVLVISALIMLIYYKNQWKAGHSLPFLIALAISYLLITQFALIKTPLGFDYQWDILYRSNDSAGYLSYQWGKMNMRPLVYPLFAQMIAGNNAQQYLTDIPWNKPVTALGNPLLSVVRGQKLLVLVSSILAAFFMMGFLRSPLPAPIFLALYDTAFYTDFFGHLLTEAVAAAWLFLILAAFFGFFWKKHWGFILAMGVGCAGIYLTRPSGIFCLVFFGIAVLYGVYKNWRAFWMPVVVSLLLMGLLIITPSMIDYVLSGSFQPTPTFALQIVAFAVEVAQPDDMEMMPDEESRKFLAGVLEKKKQEAEEEKILYPDGSSADVEMLRLRYRIANHKFRMAIGPASASEALGKGASIESSTELMKRVSIILLMKHWKEYISIGLRQFVYAMDVLSRLKTPGSFLFLYLGTMLVCLLIGGEVGFISFSMLIAHAFQVLLAGFFDIPTYRYIYATEFLVILAWSVLLVSWGSRMVLRKINHLQGS